MTIAGLNEDGLSGLHDAMVSHVERGDMPGLIALVARRGRAHIDVIGARAFGDSRPMSRDAIFRIASLTKPIAAVAAMMLIEEGVLRLEDSVDELLPELANRKVLRSLHTEAPAEVPRSALATDAPHAGCVDATAGVVPAHVSAG